MARKKPLPIIEDLLITDVAAEGKAIARHEELVIFIPYAVPGDVVDIQVTKKKKSYKISVGFDINNCFFVTICIKLTFLLKYHIYIYIYIVYNLLSYFAGQNDKILYGGSF